MLLIFITYSFRYLLLLYFVRKISESLFLFEVSPQPSVMDSRGLFQLKKPKK